jgi:broad specificity phosphatase PhoE
MEEDLTQFRITETKETQKVRRVIVVRHAESIANSQGIYQGQSYDTGLSPLGIKQAKALAKKAQGLSVKRIITSPLKRTLHTARMIAKRTGVDLAVEDDLVETNHGLWEGKRKDWIESNYSELTKLWQKNPSKVRFPQGESFMETVERVLKFLDNKNFDEDTLIVTHDNILRVMVALVKNIDIDKIWDLEIESGALSYFEVNKIKGKNVYRLLKINDTGYLEGLRSNLNNHAL